MRFVAAGCFTLVVLAACSDTAISPKALRSQAAFFDSLATVQEQKHLPADAAHISSLVYIANALAHGALPGVVTITIAGTPATAHFVGVEAVDSNETGSGNVWAAGWVDANADTLIFVSGSELTTGFIDQSVAITIGDSSEWTQQYPPQFTFSQQNVGTPCTNYPIKNQVAGADPQCHLARATLSFNVVPSTFEGSPLVIPVGAAIVSPSFNFEIVQLAGNGY